MAQEKDIDIAPAPKKSSKLILFIALGMFGLLVLGGGVVGALYYLGLVPAAPAAQAASAEAPEAQQTAGEAFYVSLDPAFTVNFSGKGRGRFLQVSVEALTRDSEVEEHIKKHMPMIRNNLVLLFSSKTYDALSTREGKEELQGQALASIQSVLEQEAGTTGIEAVYFTSFVMQ